MKTIEEEFPPESELHLDSVLADAYTRLRARAVEMERALLKIASMDHPNPSLTAARIAREALPPAPDTHQP